MTVNKADLSTIPSLIEGGRQLLSFSGKAHHGSTVPVPPTTTIDDWSIIVSPCLMGEEEGKSEGDNALLKIECEAIPQGSSHWFIKARYKYNFWGDKEGLWKDKGVANYLVVRSR